jgi:hypothetical protein
MFKDKNIGPQDANIRTILATVLILLGFFVIENPYIRIAVAVVSAVLAGTAFLRSCPLYHYLGKNTCTDQGVVASTKTPETSTESPKSTEKTD